MLNAHIPEVLTNAGIGYRGGRWLRLKGQDLDAISVNAESGGWRDHRTGEHGPFHALCERLGIDDGGIIIDRQVIKQARDNQAKADARARQHARTSWARGIHAVTPKRPPGWAQAAWDKEQERYQDQRATVYDYLLSRGLEPSLFMHMIKIAALEHSQVDQEMVEAGADFLFMIPMYQIGKSEKPEHITGVQRTYLAFEDGAHLPARKVGRAMLGKKGVTSLVAAGSPVILPESGPVLFAGEGFETVASAVQAMRRHGVVCWDWSELRAWSADIKPSVTSPLVAVLVDRDTSETGQRESAAAVRRIAAHEHGKAVYLLPPETIQPDAKRNRDWNDLLSQSSDQFAAEIIRAWHMSDKNMALAPASQAQLASAQFRRTRKADIAQAVADAADLASVMAELETKVAEYIQMYIAAQRGDSSLPQTKPLLIHVTTGGGKSHLFREKVKQFIAERIPAIILTRTHELGAEYAQAGATHYYGRAPLVDEEHPQPWTCRKYPVVMMAAKKNHAPAASACRHCEHGMSWAFLNYDPHSEPHKNAAAWLRERGLSADDVLPCEFMSWLRRIQMKMVVVAPNASFSDGLLRYREMQLIGDEESEGEQKRLPVVDEIPDLLRNISITTADLAEHAAKARKEIADIEHKAGGGEPSEEDSNVIKALQKAVDGLLRPLAAFLGEHTVDQGILHLPHELRQSIAKLRIDWLPSSTANWEKVEMEYGQAVVIPLRAAKAIVDSCQTGTLTIKSGCIEAQEMTTLGAYIAAGKPCILLDATPTADVQAAVLAAGGDIHRALITQNVEIVRYCDRAHNRTFKNDQHKAREVEQMDVSVLEMARERGRDPAVITYSTICDVADVDEKKRGYFGRHDVGHDQWNGDDLLQWGGPMLSPDAIRQRYQGQRMVALMSGAPANDWPEYSDQVVYGTWVTVGTNEEQSLVPLSANEKIREWVLNDYGNREAQIIGRARGARSEKTLQVRIHGGMPLAGLARHGLAVAGYRTESGRKLVEINGERAREAEQRIMQAMAALSSADHDTAYRAVNKWLADRNLPAVRYDTWKRVQSVYGLDKGNIQAVDNLLAALQNTVDAAQITGCDPADVASDRLAVPDLPTIYHAAACVVLDQAPPGPGAVPG
ncbi:MAG: toprim domain-containing protein [Acidithiobacillus ferrooxidans]|jgi:hypothetical protein|nr:toprim domain-containing protein [Acidithiobacillus sp.]